MYSTMWCTFRATAARHARRFPPQGQRLRSQERICLALQQPRFFSRRSRDRQKFYVNDDEPDEEDYSERYFDPRKLPKKDLLKLRDMGYLDLELLGINPDDNVENEPEQPREWDKEQQDEFDKRKGRGFVDPWDLTNEHWMSRKRVEDLPDWTPEACSRVCLERIQLYPGKIPTLSKLSRLPLPMPAEPHPGHGDTKTYVFHRKRIHATYVADKVAQLAKPQIERIIRLPSWQEKQNAVDELFEGIEFHLKAEEAILGKHPKFGFWVERALEDFLEDVDSQEQAKRDEAIGAEGASSIAIEGILSTGAEGEEGTPDADEGYSNIDEEGILSTEASVTDADLNSTQTEQEIAIVEEPPEELESYPTLDQDVASLPLFMDLYDGEDVKEAVPKILNPLKPHPFDRPGRMVEEWEISAHKTSKRIMIRQCMRKIAQTLSENESPRLFVKGRRGVGKTASLAAIVASARKSGYIVLYIPDGQRMSKRAPYVEPNKKIPDLYDVPFFSQEICENLLESHQADLERFPIDAKMLDESFTENQMEYLSDALKDNPTVAKLVQIGKERIKLSAMSLAIALEVLKNQTETPFLIVMDEFNCYYQESVFYHASFDVRVEKPIPHEQITLFKPLLEAVGVATIGETKFIKRGGVIVATTESHAVPRKLTDAMIESFNEAAIDSTSGSPLTVVDVPRFSMLEVDHILANFEATGVGMLRFDQGETLMNENEVGYLRGISSCVGQKLFDACMM